MDLGCLDLGCISVSDKHSNGTVHDFDDKECDASEKATSASRVGKNKSPKGTGQSALNALNKFTSQIKKPPHRKGSPLNWFPRKKADYLKKKIKMLQELDGMNLTLDETLGDSNPHYSRVLKEKIAAREAAHAALEARKAALVEASWRRILQAARIQSNEAEALLLKAEKTAAEAFEAAQALGVIMYDKPNCPQKPCQIESSTNNGGRSTTHTVTASFETAFEVDKQVAAAVKTAFTRLVNCPTFSKDEVKELLRKINQNPDMGGDENQELSEFCSEYEADSGSEVEALSQSDDFNSYDMDMDCKLPNLETSLRKYKRRQSLQKFNPTMLVNMMLERLRCLREDELSSLATIVATCGLNAALAEVESSKLHDPCSAVESTSNQGLSLTGRMSSAGAGTRRYLEHFMDAQTRKNQIQPELPSLDKFLVKHMSKLEREVQEAKNRRKKSSEGQLVSTDKTDGRDDLDDKMNSCEAIPDLGRILVKHSSKFEKEIEEAKRNAGKNFEIGPSKKRINDLSSSEDIPDLGSILIKHTSKLEKEVHEMRRDLGKTFDKNGKENGRSSNRVISHTKEDISEVPSLDKVLVKRVSRLEKEVQEAKDRRKNEKVEGWVTGVRKNVELPTSASQPENTTRSSSYEGIEEKENVNLNEEPDGKSKKDKKEYTVECAGGSPKKTDQVNLKAEGTLSAHGTGFANNETEGGQDKILVKPARSNYGSHRHQNKHGGNAATECEGLDKVLVKHVSRLEKEKIAFSIDEEGKVKGSARNGQSHVKFEGSLDQILVKSTSRLMREKMAAAQKPGDDQVRLSVSRREAREREMQEAWGGFSLGDSIRPHLSKLERDKAAWIEAEEEERRQAVKE